MLPTETTSPAAEAAFGIRLAFVSIAWIVGTVLVGVLMVLVSPLLVGVY